MRTTFDDFRRVMEDTIRVDMKKRWTPQLVKFINNKNEFYGFFNGEISATGGILNNVSLSNVSIYKPSGEVLDIDKIIEMSDKFDEYDYQIIEISNILISDIPEQIQTKIYELSNDVYTDIDTLDKNIYTKIKSLNDGLTTKIDITNKTIDQTITEINKLSGDYIKTKEKYGSDISWIFNRISCVINHMGVLTLDGLQQSTATLNEVFHINGIVGVPLSAGWFYTVKSSTEYKDYYFINGTKIGNGDFIKIKHDLSSVDNIQLSDVTITDIMDSDVVHQNQLNDTLLSVNTISSTLSTEIKDRFDNDLILSNWCNNLSIKLDNEISDRISNDTDLSNWIKKEEGVRFDNDLILSNQVEFLSGEISTLNDDFNTVSSDYNTFIKSTFTSISSHHDSTIKNLCIRDEEHNGEEGHNKYYMTFKDGTLVLVKIK